MQVLTQVANFVEALELPRLKDVPWRTIAIDAAMLAFLVLTSSWLIIR